MSTLARIGILGGMGPQATILFQQRLLDAIKADDDDDHIPLLIDMNTQVPSRLSFLLDGKGEDPGTVLANMARGLETAGAKALAMPCNTAHYFASSIQTAVDIPLIHMVDLACKAVAAKIGSVGKVGILASPATAKIKLFHKALEPYGLDPVFPDDNDTILGAIRSIKSLGPTPNSRKALADAARDCSNKNAECLLIGCSEFSLIADAASLSMPLVDSLDVLVENVCAFAGVGGAAI